MAVLGGLAALPERLHCGPENEWHWRVCLPPLALRSSGLILTLSLSYIYQGDRLGVALARSQGQDHDPENFGRQSLTRENGFS